MKGLKILDKVGQWPSFWRNLVAPFVVVVFHPVEFFVWFMFILFAGQLGTIINVIGRVGFQQWSLLPALCPDSVSGSFYTFAIVLMASLMVPNFIRLYHGDKPQLKPITIVFVTILFFTIILCAVFYSNGSQSMVVTDYSTLKNENVCIDWPQFTFFVLSFVFAYYSLGMEYVKYHKKELCEMDSDWVIEEDRAKKELVDDLNTPKEDKKGVKL